MLRRNWTRAELILAFNLYCRTPFGKIDKNNPEIIAVATALGRTASALSWKLANFARLDPVLKRRNISGAAHGSHLDLEIWEEFSNDWEKLALESESLRASILKKPDSRSVELASGEAMYIPDGKEREAIVRVRVNQDFFRATVLATYDGRCCITGLAVTDLLSASHIIPWSRDPKNRTNPRNGLCLNALHDRAFDRGLITVGTDYKVRLSSKLSDLADTGIDSMFLSWEGKSIAVPKRFLPEPAFLQYHVDNIFRK